MSGSPAEAAGGPPTAAPRGILGGLHRLEDLAVVACLGLMVLLPLLEVFLRRMRTGISGSIPLVQHCTLLVGMLGGALAAREGRLLALSTLPALLKGRIRGAANVYSSAVAAAIAAVLCGASFQSLLNQRGSVEAVAYGIPTWVFQAFLPAGFGLVAFRLVWHAGRSWRGRLLTLGLVALGLGFALNAPWDPEQMVVPWLVVLLAATLLGAPIFAVLGGAALILLWGEGLPISVVPLKHYTLVTNTLLPTIPLFTLAGYFLAEGGAPGRLVRVFETVAGHWRGGPAIGAVLACAFFTSFTGASGVTILALGGLLLPVLREAGYTERHSLGFMTGAGSLGLLFPPCLPLILYALVAGNIAANLPPELRQGVDITIEKMFLAGIGPGLVMVILAAALGVWLCPPGAGRRRAFNWREAREAVWGAKWELLLPVVALGSMFSGLATTVESAAITAAYAFVVETFIYRDLRAGRDLVRVMKECSLLVGGVLLILGVAMGLTHFLIFQQVPAQGVEWVQAKIHSPWIFLLVLNGFLLVVGCLMDIYSAIVVVVPLIVPMGLAFGIDPLHLGIIFLANLELGFLTPPIGMNLFLASSRFNKPMPEVIFAVLPMLAVQAVGVILITYLPWLTTLLPHRLLGRGLL